MRAQQGQPVHGESAGIDVRAPVRSGALEFAGGRLLSGRPFKFGQIRLHLPREVLLFLLRVVPRQGVVGILRHVVLPPGFAGVRCCGPPLIQRFRSCRTVVEREDVLLYRPGGMFLFGLPVTVQREDLGSQVVLHDIFLTVLDPGRLAVGARAR